MASLFALSGVLREDVVPTAEQCQQVADAVEDSSFVLTGSDDRLLRKLSLGFSLDTEVTEDLRDVIGEDAVGASFSFDLGLDKINEPVQIPG